MKSKSFQAHGVIALAIFWGALGVAPSCGACGGPKDPVKEADRKIEDIRLKAGLSRDEIEKLGIEMDAARRVCGQKLQTETDSERFQKGMSACAAESEKKLLAAKRVEEDAGMNVSVAHVLLRWELKHFLASHKTTEDDLKKVFRAAWASVERCQTQLTKRPQEAPRSLDVRQQQCYDPQVFAACAQAGYGREDCGRIVSMGIDYQWMQAKVTKRVNPSVDRKL